jgi:hypothetical protein
MWMGRLVAAVVALAVFVTGAMYWSQAEQSEASDLPLAPEVSIKVATDGCPEKDGCCQDKALDAEKQPDATATKDCSKEKSPDGGCPGGCCKDKDKASQA